MPIEISQQELADWALSISAVVSQGLYPAKALEQQITTEGYQ